MELHHLTPKAGSCGCFGVDPNHAWARPESAQRESEFLIELTKIEKGASVLDFGCGSGRHSNAFAASGFNVVGVDFSSAMVGAARRNYSAENIEFIEGDCRTVKLDRQFDLGICLYDVIGSLPDDAANEELLRNLAAHIRPGGYVAISVMSYDYTKIHAKNIVTNVDIQDQLLDLPASSTMQNSGEIFNPDYYLLDAKSRVVYRREIFDEGSELPTELIVRDRRYGREEIAALCSSAGLAVLICGFVRAGKFEMAADPQADPTKEVLVVARKSLL
ncbi:MAG: class I SAM-dependent methyltransferase [Magnetospirillum sp.]|nr:class I SAM-dependent methyltransferase [Magnetospirillum sp.]